MKKLNKTRFIICKEKNGADIIMYRHRFLCATICFESSTSPQRVSSPTYGLYAEHSKKRFRENKGSKSFCCINNSTPQQSILSIKCGRLTGSNGVHGFFEADFRSIIRNKRDPTRGILFSVTNAACYRAMVIEIGKVDDIDIFQQHPAFIHSRKRGDDNPVIL